MTWFNVLNSPRGQNGGSEVIQKLPKLGGGFGGRKVVSGGQMLDMFGR